MNLYSWFQLIFYIVVLLATGKTAWLVYGKSLSGRAYLSWIVCWVPLNGSFIASQASSPKRI